MDKKRESKVIRHIFAITCQCLLCGNMPTDRKTLLQLFERVEATEEEILQLAKDNKLEWVYDIHHNESKEEYQKNMNLSLAHYLDTNKTKT